MACDIHRVALALFIVEYCSDITNNFVVSLHAVRIFVVEKVVVDPPVYRQIFFPSHLVLDLVGCPQFGWQGVQIGFPITARERALRPTEGNNNVLSSPV